MGWDISIYNDIVDKSRDQTLTAANADVAVSLKEGDIISTSYDNTDYETSADDARLIFEALD